MSVQSEGSQRNNPTGNSGTENPIELNRQLCREIQESEWYIAAVNKRRRLLREILELYIAGQPFEHRSAIRQMVATRYPHLCEADPE